ncbi:cytochrome oxidase c subunit VIb-domain-containing protein [Parachaetomium inaequale]|uniref:Cytochrome oxidase c subunit VIb-domain-containing protein n=1 Tax=Parachaetomium inaequale TaxID=2588326 RepID=A0AAN6SMP6_9PEZI|nr:cytochrome oxidase c subunit VIb-domain-containing protein [Parachaetomium inaequale]
MGLLPNLFSSPATADDKRATEVRTGAVAPTRAERAQCWAARDTYFACLDAHGIVDALDDADGRKRAAAACRGESAGFEKDCAAQWVTYFKKWRVQDIKKKARLKELEAQGANKMDVQTDFAQR